MRFPVRIPDPFAAIPLDQKPRYVAGLDLGQKADFTALSLAKIIPNIESTPERNLDRVQVVGLRRYPLKTPYPTIVAKVAETLNHPSLHFDQTRGYLPKPTLLIDATGVGAATVDQFLATPINADMIAVTITSGREAREDVWNETTTPAWYVPKVDLVGSVMTALESTPQRLEIASQIGEEAGILNAELLNFRVKVTLSANPRFEAGGVGVDGHREGTHDDLLLATAMVVWWVGRRKEDRRLRRGRNPMAGWRG